MTDCSLFALEKYFKMPANLNALVRYKTINSCLYGGRRKWAIDELIDACSEALGESRGRYERISERTIRDDIRVMRSDILGFNAPIRQERGLYFYDDPGYSIMSVGITDMKLIDRIIKMLIDIRSEVKHPELEIVLERLLKISPEGAGMKASETTKAPKTEMESDMFGLPSPREQASEKPEMAKEAVAQAKRKIASRFSTFDASEDHAALSAPAMAPEPVQAYGFLWGDLLGVIGRQ